MKSNDNSPPLTGKTMIATHMEGHRAAFACDGGHSMPNACNQTYAEACKEMDEVEKARQMYLAHEAYSFLKKRFNEERGAGK